LSNITLTPNDYWECFVFALKMWYVGKKAKQDWRRAGERDIGDYLNDHIEGKLGEIAFAKFLKEYHGIDVEVDLEIKPGIHAINSSDIKAVTIGGVKRSPRIKIDVKTTSLKSKYLLIDAKEFRTRVYDAYVLVMLNLPKDHLLRFLINRIEIPEDLKKHIESLEHIEATIAGFAYRNDVEEKGKLYKAGDWLPDPDKPNRKLVQLKADSYALSINKLRSSEGDWRELVYKLYNAN